MIKSIGDKTLVGIDELLYPCGLRGYLESLVSYDADKYISLGDKCFEKQDYKSAASHYDQALQLKPNDSLIYKKRGRSRYFLGDKKSAIDDYTEAIKINPNFAIAYYERGIVHSVLGDNQGANADFKQAADLFYKQEDQDFYQEALDRIRELELQENNKSHKQLQQLWNVGDHVMHKTFGTGQITHVFGSGNKVSLAIRFNERGQKVIDPIIAQLVKID
ncbi:tetratricopeptide repeat protein [Dolichospermum sp. FACHB-1091]|uniref:tetratricopeptide repeat protein n=1 Tax=Dolichospermum sp. FACHB-1091 TaxID=2692798 RepID=UPI001F551EAE|nr:tetratricopeptide repeat protein [Dolichospermum sp. FACHB-1091]